MVVTTADCVRASGPTGAFYQNWAFAPGFHDGQTPYGIWPARGLQVTPGWTEAENAAQDVGFAILNPLDGHHLTDVVGDQTPWFRGDPFPEPPSLTVYSFGYLDGQATDDQEAADDQARAIGLGYCSGATTNDGMGEDLRVISCYRGGNTTGGPWFRNFDRDTGRGHLFCVSNWIPADDPYSIRCAPLGQSAKRIYESAQES
ncbi:hypothetical protein MXD61_15715 [Frankia sp. AgPm24]|uniref:trypsin-like serine peptidase n=1 Tax=Frankia sp. AgPm24 TaxID=631128 RepID=UPI00200EAE18|nr:hypothetical protein [Frankia sp. AgPm24]MCK9923301.1 hypothetical protein [Frankia sp. AgPm24]